MMDEFELIARLTPSLPTNDSTVVGAGDDCALIDLGLPDRWLLFKTDAVVEGIHFTMTAAPEKIGHKALGRCLSDVAAMAGTPTHALITLALPADFDSGFLERIYAGINTLAQRHGVAIVGGETTINPERMLISASVLGTVTRGKSPLRSGAKAGDAIFVTGELGGSLSGKHLDFEPRLSEARWLAENFSIHAMMDISDGLAGDLRHILKASKVGAELLSDAIPISHAAKSATRAESSASPPSHEPPPQPIPLPLGGAEGARRAGEGAVHGPNACEKRKGASHELPLLGESADVWTPPHPLLAALTDGEDFELLFTAAGRDGVPLLEAWKKQFPELRLSCIGRITAEPGLTIRDKKGVRPLSAHGYVHFQKP